MSGNSEYVPPAEAIARRFGLETLRVKRDDKRKRLLPSHARALVVAWNAMCPAGTKVHFYPLWGDWERYRVEEIDRPASILPSGEPVLWLAHVAGCVAARHCEPAELREPRRQGGSGIKPLEEEAAEDIDAERIAREITSSGPDLLRAMERAAAAEGAAPIWLNDLLNAVEGHHVR